MIKKSIASILIILIFINSIGCWSYSQINSTIDTSEFKKNDRVKITTIDGRVYILTNVTIEGSELKGEVPLSHLERERGNIPEEIVLSLKEIKIIEVGKRDFRKTYGYVLLVGLIGYIGLVLVYKWAGGFEGF